MRKVKNMTLRVSGKNMNVGEALRSHAEGRISDAVEKYFDGGFDAQVTIGPDGAGYKTDCNVHLDSGIVLRVSADASDPRLSFEQAVDKIAKRLRRYKRKIKSHQQRGGADFDAAAAADYVLAVPNEDEEVPADFTPIIVAETQTRVRTMTVGMAVMELDLHGGPVVVFRNAGNGTLNVVYRRSDGNFGWIDPSLNSGEVGGAL